MFNPTIKQLFFSFDSYMHVYIYILQRTCMVIDDDGVDEADLSK